MYSEKRNVCQLLALLKSHSISHFVVSPGSRHVPIVISMEYDPFFKLYSVVDERSASFFALGLIQKLKEPVGIICTSGTASANYCSAINESLYQELPLLVITADKPEYLRDQHEDQMIRQSTMYSTITKMVANLPLVNSENDAWHCNRLINEALLELDHHGRGPVQINIPIPEHTDEFNTPNLPEERMVKRYDLSSTDFADVAKQLSEKKVAVVCGEGFMITREQNSILDRFCEKTGAVVLCDKMSNCHVNNGIQNAFTVISALNNADVTSLAPDIIISIRANFSFNDSLKNFVNKVKKNGIKADNWYVHPSGRLVDPYKGLLSRIYEMDEFDFFSKVVDSFGTLSSDAEYVEIWRTISDSIEEPSDSYGHLGATGLLLKNIPSGSVLQLSNSNSVRMAQLFQLDPSIEVHCNRGTDGIDGCMSTAVGFASESDQKVFLMIGDLTFFYDMNALWNRQLSKNLRIFLENNGGGSILHLPPRPEFASNLLPNYISAKHDASAKAWALDRGLTYLSATNEQELQDSIKQFTSEDVEGPMILEVFNDLLDDMNKFKQYHATVNRHKLDQSIKTRSKRVIMVVLHMLGIDPDSFKSTITGK